MEFEVTSMLQRLAEIDPKRKERYRDVRREVDESKNKTFVNLNS